MTGKTWGPFTGAQLTVLGTAALLCLAIPGGLWAAGKVPFTYVSLFDPGSQYRAKIVKGGAVIVSDGSGPMTVDGGVTVSGSVIATVAAPADFVHQVSAISVGCHPIALATASQALVVTRIMIAPSSGASSSSTMLLFTNQSACAAGLGFIEIIPVVTNNLIEVDLTPGVAVPAGTGGLWIGTGNVTGNVTITGYQVAAAAVPAVAAAAGQNDPRQLSAVRR